VQKRRWLIVVLVLTTLFGVGYLGVCAAVYKYQDKLLFFPDDYFAQDPSSAGLSVEEFEVEVEPGSTITGWISEIDPAAPWVLHFHGNGGNISHRIDHLLLFKQLGFNGVVFDYRGYGKSKGTPSEAGLVADGHAMVKYLTEERGVNEQRLVYFGESLGGGVAAAVSETEPPRALILKSTFTSVPDMAAELYPFLPARMLSKTEFSTKDRVPKFLFPKLVIHSRVDTIIPFAHGQRLYQLCGEPKAFLELHRDHNTSPLDLGEDFKRAVHDLVQESVPKDW